MPLRYQLSLLKKTFVNQKTASMMPLRYQLSLLKKTIVNQKKASMMITLISKVLILLMFMTMKTIFQWMATLHCKS